MDRTGSPKPKGFRKFAPAKARKKFKKSRILEWAKSIYGPVFQEIPLGTLPELVRTKVSDKGKKTLKWYCIWRTKPYRRFIGRMPFFANVTYGIPRDDTVNCLRNHINWYEDLVRNHGEVYAVKLLKRVRDACLRYGSDQSYERINEVQLHDDGLPTKVGHLMPFLKSKDINRRRFAISILDIIKLCVVEGDKPSTTSIIDLPKGSIKVTNSYIGETLFQYGQAHTDKGKLQQIISSFRSELQRMFPERSQAKRLESLTSLSDIHMSVRKGPNGPALGTIIEDFNGVKQSGLLEPIKRIAEITENIQLSSILNEMEIEVPSALSLEDAEAMQLDSRLAIKYEAWAKTRYFAICDWFSQSALKGLHKWIFGWLEKQTEDGTMSQDRVAEIVRQWTMIGNTCDECHSGVYSLDLTKATDRLPATIQREIIQQIFGKEFADNWYTICTKRSFRTPDNETVVFEVGQPLGVYSSWAMLALTHHVVCRLALRLAGERYDSKNPRYVVIGDDVAMTGKHLAEQYHFLMNTVLQVECSATKGFSPETCLGVNALLRETKSISAELAKRIFVDGMELSVVSPETLKSAMEYPADFPSLIYQLTNRGCFSDKSSSVAPLALAGLGFTPDLACTFATFPLRAAISKETVMQVSGTNLNLLDYIPWFQSEIPISESELETMFRWSVRSSLQSILSKFKAQYDKFIALVSGPRKYGNGMYHFKTLEYVTRTLLNKAMFQIISLVKETDALNFQGPGMQLDLIASALNTMLDFEQALMGKPPGKRENLHRMRSRVITKLQPLVLQAVKKAKENYGILMIDSGEQINFVPEELSDLTSQNLVARSLLSQELSKLNHDKMWENQQRLVTQRSLEFRN